MFLPMISNQGSISSYLEYSQKVTQGGLLE